MSVSSISGTNSINPFDSLTNLRPVSGNDSGKDSTTASGVAKQGNFASAIQQALTQFGISAPDGTAGSTSTASSTTTAPSDTADATTTQDPTQALAGFVQSLFAALHAQSTGGAAAPASTASATSSAGGTDAVAATAGGGKGHHHHHGGAGKLESGLQSLIQQIGSGTSDTTTTASGDGSTTDSSTATGTVGDLQKSFNALLTADGASGSGANLTSFLQALSQKLEGAPPTGNVVNTTV